MLIHFEMTFSKICRDGRDRKARLEMEKKTCHGQVCDIILTLGLKILKMCKCKYAGKKYDIVDNLSFQDKNIPHRPRRSV